MYMEFRKMVMITLYARQQKRHRYIEQSFGLCGGRVIWENGIETCIISYKKQIASPGSMQDTGCLGLVHWDELILYAFFIVIIKVYFYSVYTTS